MLPAEPAWEQKQDPATYKKGSLRSSEKSKSGQNKRSGIKRLKNFPEQYTSLSVSYIFASLFNYPPQANSAEIHSFVQIN
jgi:hypothetical protein